MNENQGQNMSDECRWGKLRSALHGAQVNYKGIHFALEHFWRAQRHVFLEAVDYAYEVLKSQKNTSQPPEYIPVQQWYLEFLLPLLTSVHRDKALTDFYPKLSLLHPWCPVLYSLDASILSEDEIGMLCIPRRYLKKHGLSKSPNIPNQYTSQKLAPNTLSATTQNTEKKHNVLRYQYAWLVDPNRCNNMTFGSNAPLVWELDSLLECVMDELFHDFIPARGEWTPKSDLRHHSTGFKLGWHPPYSQPHIEGMDLLTIPSRDDIEGLNLDWIYNQLGVDDLMNLTQHIPVKKWALCGFLCAKHTKNPKSFSRLHVLVSKQHMWAFWGSNSRFWR